MSDLLETIDPEANAAPYSVSEISAAVKRVVEGEFGHVRVRGELGRVSRPASGHVYLDLKDERATLNGVIWKGTARSLRIAPEEGMEVIATGRLTTFPGASRYQLIIESLAPAGVGALMAMLEKRRTALQAEGLFAAERKRPLPFLPDLIGVITSPSGAVIRDILHRLGDRFPRPVLIWPVPVQGDACAPAVAAAIGKFNALPEIGELRRPDVIIVARGGGSLEDLWGFNEEIVVRAVAESTIPIISAIGHETDTTLIDHAADRRAPTPTAAAEMAVPVRLDLVAALAALDDRRRLALRREVSQRQQRLRDVSRGLPLGEVLLADRVQKLDGLGLRLPAAFSSLVKSGRLKLTVGAAGRFGPPLLVLGLERRRQRLSLAGQGVRPAGFKFVARRLSESLEAKGARLDRVTAAIIGAQGARLQAAGRILASLGPQAVLERGYAIVRGEDGHTITQSAAASAARRLEVVFRDGSVAARPEQGVATKRGGSRRQSRSDGEQGTLF